MENLVIIKKQVASIEWNKEQAIKEAKEIMSKYEGIVFTEEDLPQAKKEIATLRKVSKEINAQALAIDKELTNPVKQFRNEVKEVKAIVDNGIEYINEQVKTFEEAMKQDRKNEIMSFDEWESIKEYHAFDESWLLKKWTDKLLKTEFSDILYSINKELEAIKTNADTLQLDANTYMEMLKSNSYNELVPILNRMKEDYELLTSKSSEEQSKDTTVTPIEDDEVITIKRTITGAKSKLIALKEYALKLGLKYE